MDNHNVRRDRPRLSSNEIAQHKDFDSVLNDYQIMKKPFYKNPWFFGVTGVASVSLLIGANYSFTDSPAESYPLAAKTTESAPPKDESKTIYLASLESAEVQDGPENPVKTKLIPLKKKEIHDNTSTLKNKSFNQSEIVNTETSIEISADSKTKKHKPVIAEDHSQANSALQNHPKINGKIGGMLKTGSVNTSTVILTDSKIPISGFEMHIATEFGFKVFRSKSNRLSSEMVAAIQSAQSNTEVYFEGISGDIGASRPLRLSPLKFTLTK
ncbi:MAG: hypothetical protein AB8B72_08085 [Crocinitomicaceae bacterium]